MKNLIQQIRASYKAIKLETQDGNVLVYSGQEPETGQAIAIKVLPRLLGDDPQIAARFRDLAQGIRQLNHPNISAVRKVGEESGLPYLVTRVLEKGQALTSKLDQPWAVDAAADLVMQVGQALEHAYRKGVTHGSLSPDKIALQDDGRVQVNDLGLAELQRLAGAVATAGAASPYLAPEAAAGEAPGAAGDVYALGAVLYRLLAQRDPQAIHGEILPPSRFNPKVPPAMDAVAVKALASDPQQRFPDAKAFLAALGAVTLAPAIKARSPGKGVTCRGCGATKQTGHFCRKCGTRLEVTESVLDEPIQVTTIEVGRVEVLGGGVEMHPVAIAQPMTVATGEVSELFPQPLEMPELDLSSMWPAGGEGGQDTGEQAPGLVAQAIITMPEPPPMPVIDWAEIAPPMTEVPVIEDSTSS